VNEEVFFWYFLHDVLVAPSVFFSVLFFFGLLSLYFGCSTSFCCLCISESMNTFSGLCCLIVLLTFNGIFTCFILILLEWIDHNIAGAVTLPFG
jgi:hypothetical protein